MLSCTTIVHSLAQVFSKLTAADLMYHIIKMSISQQPLVRIQYNFTRMIDTKPSCAYFRRVALELFLK